MSSFACYDCVYSAKYKSALTIHSQSFHTPTKPYSCYNCRQTYAAKKRLFDHVNQRHQAYATKNFECAECKRRFWSVISLGMHRQQHSGHTYACDDCNKSFALKMNLVRHSRMRNEKLAFVCFHCEKSFSAFDGIKSHIQRAHKDNDYDRKKLCDDCSFRFSSYHNLIRHTSAYHLMVKPFRCYECDQDFNDVARLLCHRLCQQPPKTDPFGKGILKERIQCDDCGKDFEPNKFTFANHVAVAHVTTLRRLTCIDRSKKADYFRCQFCEKFYPSKGSLRLHERKHANSERFPCSLCTKSFTEAGTLQAHVSFKHGGLNIAYQCDSCDKIFAGSSGLKSAFMRHIRFNHISAGRRQKSKNPMKNAIIVNGRTFFQCSKCVQRCTTLKRLRDHELQHRKNDSNFQCQSCNRSYKTKDALHFHERFKHSGQKRLTCSVCDRTSADSKTLKVHMKAMHSETKAIYQCDMCEKDFSMRANLYKHLIRQHHIIERAD